MNAQPCAVLDCNKITQPGHVLCPVHEPEVTPGAGTMVMPSPEGGVQRGDPRPRPVQAVPEPSPEPYSLPAPAPGYPLPPTAVPMTPLQFLAEAMQGQHGMMKQMFANAMVQAMADAVRRL